MEYLNKRAQAVFERLTNGLTECGQSRVVDNSRTFTPVTVAYLFSTGTGGKVYSIAHYGEQFGDRIANPEMEFLAINGFICPITWRNDCIGMHQQLAKFSPDGKLQSFYHREQAAATRFASTWMRTIGAQQEV